MAPWLDTHRLRGAELDRRGARALHRRLVGRPLLLRLLALCSRLGDGPLWVGVILVLPLLDGVAGAQCAWLMLATGSANLVIYWVVKRSTRRCRPFEQCDDIRACMVAPDRFSFPSGHVLHATAFALLLSAFHPALAWPLGLFAAVLALARVVLGLHYPSDVLAGAALGLCTAGAALLAR
jgi:undecaprenyl-diphosphatase